MGQLSRVFSKVFTQSGVLLEGQVKLGKSDIFTSKSGSKSRIFCESFIDK